MVFISESLHCNHESFDFLCLFESPSDSKACEIFDSFVPTQLSLIALAKMERLRIFKSPLRIDRVCYSVAWPAISLSELGWIAKMIRRVGLRSCRANSSWLAVRTRTGDPAD